ncbi:hypothetical protein Leryth_010773 [Lithospermum erythrorhizon]|nr:hypothetical protein Leryth_010773 [Lithospermum erythrorhizon]
MSQTLGGSSRCGWVLGPTLDKVIKNVAWRKHSQLVASCKNALDKLDVLVDSTDPDPSTCTPLYGFANLNDAEFVLQPVVLAIGSGSPKVVEPALDGVYRLFSFGLIRCQLDVPSGSGSGGGAGGGGGEQGSIIFQLIDAVWKCGGIGEESVELGVLKVLLSAVRSPCLTISGDCLIYIVKCCYNIYLGGLNGTNQICAKAVLAQIMLIVFTRVEENSMIVDFKSVSVTQLLEFADRNLNEGSSIQFAQNFVNEIIETREALPPPTHPPIILRQANHQSQTEPNEPDSDSSGYSKIREDGFALYKNVCKLSMKFSSQEQPDDQILIRGKVLSLELLKVIMDNAGPEWCNNERFLSLIKQFLCLSLLKNSALSVMAIFQLLCSIFESLLSKFRSKLKSEIGIFFPMLILRVLENVLQPSFLQKMTVLHLLDKIFQDPQIVIDVFVNYDCDVDAPNVFERTVNGLLKTALGPPPGSTTNLSPAQDSAFRLESVKCLASIVKSMGAWMDLQLKVGNKDLPKSSDDENSADILAGPVEDADYELHSEANSEVSDAATLEQRRSYKIQLQKGVSMFNRKPSKGIELLISMKRIGSSPEAVASFLKNTSGLNPTMIGDYLGEREEFNLKVMHAYVDSFNFVGMDFGGAIRFFLKGFRLPGEAQKIDRLMEKFAERYCKCNPTSFSSADTAYVLAYSVIMLNTDAHNNMVKDKMSKADFIRNNRGINDGKDLPEDFLGTLYDQIVKNEIKMNADSSAPQSKPGNSLNRLLGLDGILNLVWKQTEEQPLGANGVLIKHIQEQFRANSGKSESIFYSVSDPAILRFMAEVSWGPMLAAFSITVDQSDDKVATSKCLEGFRNAVHVTAVLGMQTQRDAFVTTIAKFTNLHCAADMKQKNVDAVKAIISIAIEDGNHLQEAWEHILTCLSRFEHLQLLGEGAPSDASYLTTSNGEIEERTLKTASISSMKKKGTIQNPAVAAVVRGGSYDSTSVGINSQGLVTPEQMNTFISNLNLLDQIGNFELNHIFAHSQRLNSEAIVAFVKALCKVSMSELQSPTDPRVFSLTKIVEVAHYNMNRIRLVWSRIWNVLSDFFVTVGLFENLSVAIFVMDSLRQLSMKFLEREELANYNFQNEFLRPFVTVMKRSNSAEIRELIVRCLSQMVLTRVSNVKSGWKSVFMVFTAAGADERKNIVLLAFETMEKIVREYFPYITETETGPFTDCVRCLITFTNNKFNSDISLNAIAFLRFCAVKLADEGFVSSEKSKDCDPSVPEKIDSCLNEQTNTITDIDDNFSFWIPLLSGLAILTSDPRPAIRKSALEVLFNILKDHGHLFSQQFWITVFSSIVCPIFNSTSDKPEKQEDTSPSSGSFNSDLSIWDPETAAVGAQCLVDIFVGFFGILRNQLPSVVSILVDFMTSPGQGPSSAGIDALMRLARQFNGKLSDEEWRDIFLTFRESAATSHPGIIKLWRTINSIDVSEDDHHYDDLEQSSAEDESLQTVAYVVSRMKSHIAAQVLIIQVVSDLCKLQQQSLSPETVGMVIDIYSSIATHAHELNSDAVLMHKLQIACTILEISEPPIVHFEIESYQTFLHILQHLLATSPSSNEATLEHHIISVCEMILQIYLGISGLGNNQQKELSEPTNLQWTLPLCSAKKEELAAKTPLVTAALQILCDLERDCFERYASRLFPLLVDLVRSEHSSGEVQLILSKLFQSCIGPMITRNCKFTA